MEAGLTGLAPLSSAILKLGVLACCEFDVEKGFGTPLGVVEKILDNGCHPR